MVEAFNAAGFPIPAPKASMFAWAKIPEKRSPRLGGVLQAPDREGRRGGAAPGIGFGEQGDEYVRVALVENEQRLRQAARHVRRFFETADQTLHTVIPLSANG